MSEAVISYATLILADAGLDVSADNLTALTKAAGASIDNIWAETFSKALEGKDLKEILSGFHAAGASAPAAAGSAAAASGDAAAEEEAPEEAAEESDDDMGFGLFD